MERRTVGIDKKAQKDNIVFRLKGKGFTFASSLFRTESQKLFGLLMVTCPVIFGSVVLYFGVQSGSSSTFSMCLLVETETSVAVLNKFYCKAFCSQWRIFDQLSPVKGIEMFCPKRS